MSFAEEYFEALIAGVEEVRKNRPALLAAAESVASRLVREGDFYIASVRPDFASEGYIRSGGLMMLKEYSPGQALSSKDVVLVGWTGTPVDRDNALLEHLQDTGAFTVGIGPAIGDLPGKVHAFLESSPPLPPELVSRFGGEAYPLVSVQNLVLLWTFTGEFVAACTRRGQMPALFQSVLVPGARARNANLGTRRFHLEHSVAPLPPGRLGSRYLDAIERSFRTVREQTPAIAKVAQACVDTLERGNCIHAFLISHFPIHQAGAPGDPNDMTPLKFRSGETPDSEELEKKLRPGDLFFFLGYYRRPVKAYTIARRLGCTIVEIISGTDEPWPTGPLPDHIIRPGWPYTDAMVSVPGYDIRILPASGILQAALYWAIVGEMRT